MRKPTLGLLLIGSLTITVVIAYNACSVRRNEAVVNGGLGSSSTQPSTTSTSSNSNASSSSSSSLVSTGVLKLTAAGQALNLPFSGRVMMVRSVPAMKTDVYLQVAGLAASTKYDVHLHNQPCSLGGGGHYKIDAKNTATSEDNEVWVSVTTGADGSGTSSKSVQHLVRPEGQSVVIHAADGSRIVCGDLAPQAAVSSKSGRFAAIAAGKTAGLNIKGGAVMIRNASANQTVVKARISGLSPSTTYTAHVHNQACANGDGGSHYKMNPAVTEMTASSANEFWLTLTTNSAGSAEARVEADHVARADAMSIVIHDPVTPANRLACVDLATDGGFMATDVGLQRGFNVLGTGSIDRLSSGATQVNISVSGLMANTNYIPHVHDRPCHVSAGGGHYKIDYSNTAALESNEIWAHFTTDGTGSGVGSVVVPHLARAEAQSIVLHDPTDGSRIACVDVY